MERVENVAGEFRKAAHSQMAATTQRTIRENVNISSQLAQLTDKATNLTAENDKLVSDLCSTSTNKSTNSAVACHLIFSTSILRPIPQR